MVSKGTQITVVCIVLAVVFAQVVSMFVGRTSLPVVVLLGIGVVLPMIINYWRTSGRTI
jgi:protein-S-isoprenylcysteine O-methyltransferase Ste14